MQKVYFHRSNAMLEAVTLSLTGALRYRYLCENIFPSEVICEIRKYKVPNNRGILSTSYTLEKPFKEHSPYNSHRKIIFQAADLALSINKRNY